MVSGSNHEERTRLPVGEPVALPAQVGRPEGRAYRGEYVTLAPVVARTDAAGLYACSHGEPESEQLWTYIAYGPFADEGAMATWLEQCQRSSDPLFFSVTDQRLGSLAGMVSFLSIAPSALRLELGHIWYGPAAQRTKVNTECIYLMLCESFDRLGYRRVEWKCDSLNERSKAAAARLGFQFEGVFRQHRVVKGRNRDTAWFSMLDTEWPAAKSNMERWLYENEDGASSLAQMNGRVHRDVELKHRRLAGS